MTFIFNSPIKLNIPRIPFMANPAISIPVTVPIKDGFATNPLYDKFGTKAEIEMVAKTNPRIQKILSENNLALKINDVELEKLKNGHLKETRIVAAKIYSSLPKELKDKVNLAHLQEAAILHDYGKVLIPDNILNKSGKLNNEEREIMQLHSELGYELLKNKGLSEDTMKMIKYHHQRPDGKGYPKADLNYEYDLGTEILTVADKYTALREKRSYKNPLSKYEALEIIAKDVNNGLVSQDVYTALVSAT